MKRTAMSFALILCLTRAAALAHAGEETIQLKEAPMRDLTKARCVTCHSLDYIQMNAAVMDGAAWAKSVRKMIDRFGAPITDEEANQITAYLAEHYSAEAGESKRAR